MNTFTLLGISVHVLYLYSIFHIYFKSPILKGLQSISISQIVPAKRLVLIIPDGLQADKAFHRKYAKKTSFLRSILMRNGSWGVSHSRVPTESRVGHVSILAGTYEDVSAITNGWKNNPVAFDSVINQSSTTWYWGERDIIGIFDHAAKNIKSYCHNSDAIDFASKDPSKLDQWVFDKVKEFLVEAKSSEKLNKELHQDNLLFILHLNGIDLNGHSAKPDSVEYIENIALVDAGIKNTTKLFDSFYDDGMTAFIVTSDHGMTPRGTHGTGNQIEIETPFIAWGAGIKQPHFERNVNDDLQSTIWGLEDYKRHDMEQVSLAPLMSFLIGCSIPVNSIGQLPYKILDVNDDQKAAGMLLNLKQIMEQYNAHEQNVVESAFIFTNYSIVEDLQGYTRFQKIAYLIDNNEFITAINECKLFISLLLRGIHYYQNYNRFYLSIVVNIGFVTWMLFVLVKILRDHTNVLTASHVARLTFLQSKLFSWIWYLTALIVGVLLWHRSKNYALILFSLFPLLMLKHLVSKIVVLRVSSSIDIEKMSTFSLQMIAIILGVEIIVLSFFKRGTLSFIGVALSCLPWLKYISRWDVTMSTKQKCICVSWSVSALLISIFPQIPVVTGEENYFLVVLAGFIGTTIGLIYCFLMKNNNSLVISAITGLLLMAIVVKMHTVVSINNGRGLPIMNKIFSWSSLFILPAMAFMVNSASIVRLLSISMSLFSIYILLAISYEALFLLVLIAHLVFWILMEMFVFSSADRPSEEESEGVLNTEHLRIAFIFLYFIFLSFFGTGNIASLNSFDVATTFCFQTVLNRTLQGVILSMKVFIPFGIITIFFRSLQSLIDIPMQATFLVVLLMTDLMALNFFFLIKDEGSWLDIGQSVCHFIITSVIIVILVPIYELSYFISGKITYEEEKKHSL